MSSIKCVLIASLPILFGGCAHSMLWDKPGASESEFNKDRYACLQESQQPYSSANSFSSSSFLLGSIYGSGYGGGFGNSSSGMSTNNALFASCMNAKGWALKDKNVALQQVQERATNFREAMSTAAEEARKRCTRPEFQPFYSKTACDAKNITIDQLSDTSKATEPEKAAALMVYREVKISLDRLNASLQQNGGANGAELADFIAKKHVASEVNLQSLYGGYITWGQYNKQRQEINLEILEKIYQLKQSGK